MVVEYAGCYAYHSEPISEERSQHPFLIGNIRTHIALRHTVCAAIFTLLWHGWIMDILSGDFIPGGYIKYTYMIGAAYLDSFLSLFFTRPEYNWSIH